MGLLGDAFGAITNTIDAGTGGWWSDQSTKASAKRQYKYNYNLMKENQAFQQFMAENAHQMEMADLQAAGLNPALTVTGSSAGSIAGSSSSQSTGGGQAVDTLKNIVDSINAIRTTNAQIDLMGKQGKADMINANANATNAKTNAKTAKGGAAGRILGNDFNIEKGIKDWKQAWNNLFK